MYITCGKMLICQWPSRHAVRWLTGGGGSAQSPAHGARDLASRGDRPATQLQSCCQWLFHHWESPSNGWNPSKMPWKWLISKKIPFKMPEIPRKIVINDGNSGANQRDLTRENHDIMGIQWWYNPIRIPIFRSHWFFLRNLLNIQIYIYIHWLSHSTQTISRGSSHWMKRWKSEIPLESHDFFPEGNAMISKRHTRIHQNPINIRLKSH